MALPTRARRRSRRSPSLLANPRRGRRRRDRGVRARPSVLDRRLGGVCPWRRDRRSGALRPGVGRVRDHAHVAASASSATSPSTSRPTVPTPRAIPSSSSAAGGRSRHPTTGAPPASTGATRSTTGARCATTGYRWWVERFRRTLELVDAVRIDHFRGFVAYWSVPEQHRTARHGHWRRGPGREVFDAVSARLGPAAGRRREPRRDHAGGGTAARGVRHAGCVVLQFMFTDNLRNRPRPPTDDNVVIYTGTHDNDTTNGWWSGLSASEHGRVDAELAALRHRRAAARVGSSSVSRS